MLEDDPNANEQLKKETIDESQVRWGPKHKGAQTLAKFYSSGGYNHVNNKLNRLAKHWNVPPNSINFSYVKGA